MDLIGIDVSWADMAVWWNHAVSFVAPLIVPSAGVIVLALVAYFLGSWFLRFIHRRFAAKTATHLDDELVRTIRQALWLTVIAWAVWRIMGLWIPVLGAENAEGTWVPYTTQPHDWVSGIWIGLVFVPLSRFVAHVMHTLESRVIARTKGTPLDETALPMINRLVRYVVMSIGVLLAMAHLGFPIGPLLASAGVAGLALSLAARDTLSNLIAGVLLIVDRPFQVGDRIELWNVPRETGTWGDVIEIGLRATKIRNPDNLIVVVPNNEIMRRDIISYTMSGDDIRLRIPFSCAYESDIEQAKTLLVDAARGVRGVKLDPAPIVVVRGLGPSEVNLQLRVWIHDARNRRSIADEVTEKSMVKFSEAGVEIPYPKRDLHIKRSEAGSHIRREPGAMGDLPR